MYDASHRHLVSSTRFVFNHAMAYREFGKPEDLAAVEHGLRYLREVHRNPATGGYAWTLRDGVVEDATNHCYGVAFVLLAYSCALKAGIGEARSWMDETWQLLETRFWEPAFGLYKDEADADWNFTDYRGQNANMHMCEAMLAAFEAGADERPELDGLEGNRVLSELFVACDRLRKDPRDDTGVSRVVDLAPVVAGHRPPFGIDARLWDALGERSTGLVDLLAAGDTPEDELVKAATTLTEALRRLV